MFGSRVSFGVFLKPLTTEFEWTRGLVAGAFSASTIVQALSSIMMGWANDRMGPRFVLTVCGILVGTGLLLVSLVNSVWQLYLCYVLLVGVGMGSLVAPQMSTIARWFVKRRNLMTAAMMAGGGLGGLIGPPLVTWIVYTYSWREAYLYLGAGVFVFMVVSAQFLRRDPSKMGQVPYGHESGATRQTAGGNFGTFFARSFQNQNLLADSPDYVLCGLLSMGCSGPCHSLRHRPGEFSRGGSPGTGILEWSTAVGKHLPGLDGRQNRQPERSGNLHVPFIPRGAFIVLC